MMRKAGAQSDLGLGPSFLTSYWLAFWRSSDA
jgi:hypothetical protein